MYAHVNKLIKKKKKRKYQARPSWFMPVILASQEAEIRKTVV
jgi:hypothetical protein